MDNIKNFLKAIGFTLKDGESDLIYSKTYANFNNYEITLKLNEDDIAKSTIDYGDDIKYGRATTQNLHQKETFVVLECIDRLITKGYSPKEIIIEKDYPSGGKEKGQYLDILITKEGLPFYMIECKQYGNAYEEEYKKLNDNGGQLFTYFTNDRAVKAICLYSSRLFNGKIESNYCIIDTSDFEGSDKKDIFNKWNKEYTNSGIFDYLYGANSIGITKDQLKSLSEDKKLYNGFARILRKFAVSDLTNAYNKLFNLFLCKIVDEDKLYSDNEYKIQFQWKKEDTSYDVLGRLSNLYKEGIEKYLRIDVTDYSKDKFIENIEKLSAENKDLCQELIREFNELRFIKNNEFAFIEVFNMETFKQNSLILKAVVKLFEKVRIKYTDKQQFLGDFFERLLNIGIKQTEGQFFTPIPIANFIVNSIPFENIINNKIDNNDNKFLPYMIDYACGAGHFITEYMHRIEPILSKYSQKDMKTNLQVQNLKKWANNQYKWAEEFVYGIEKDYRLTKTSKIACFLNGDGDANIITGNGLDSFDSEIFQNTILYQDNNQAEKYNKDNPVFDCVIANPPYSVQDFKETLKKTNEEPYGEKNFSLFKDLGTNSDDIECLFMERTKQLIKEGGYAAIVISNTFLTNPGIHQKTRELILENFKIKGIVELGSGAFMATGTNTVVLFMEKRKQGDIDRIKNIIAKFKKNPENINFNNKTKIISQFLKDNYNELEFEDYASMFTGNLTDKFKQSDLYEEYLDDIITNIEISIEKKTNSKEIEKLKNLINDISIGKDNIDLSSLVKTELKKLYNYLLNEDVKTIIVHAGKNKDEIANFLGYKFSKRKGDEGLKELSDKIIKELDTYTNRSTINSKLYNPNDLFDNTKINYYIYKNFTEKISDTDLCNMEKCLKNNIFFSNLNSLFDYNSIEFNANISLQSKKKIKIETRYPLIKLKNIKDIYIQKGNNAPQGKEYFENGDIPFIRAGNLNSIDEKFYIIPDANSFVNKLAIDNHNLIMMPKDTIVFPISGRSIDTNNIGFLQTDSYITNHLIGIYHKNKYIRKYLYEIFNSFKMSNLKSNISDYPTIKPISVKNFRVPDIQNSKILEDMYKEITDIEYSYIDKTDKINSINKEIQTLFNKDIDDNKQIKLSKYLKLEYGIALPERERNEGKFPVVGSSGVVGLHDEYLLKGPSIIVGRKGSVGKVHYIKNNCTPIDTTFYVVINKEKIRLKYAFYLLKSLNLNELNIGLGPGGVNRKTIHNKLISVPNLDIQDQFIKKIEVYEKQIEELQKEIDGIPAKKQAILDKYLK